MRRNLYIHGALPFALALTFGSLGCSKPSIEKPAQEPPKVTVVEAVEKSIVDYDDFVGRTEASETVEVRSRVSGFLLSANFKDGDFVKKDDILFSIQPELYQAIHQQSLSRIALWDSRKELADSKLQRAKSLIATNAISKDEYEEAVAAVKEAEASIVAAKADADRTALDLKCTQVRAEISGRVDRAMYSSGNMVTGGIGSGSLLTRIVNNNPIYAYIDIDERSVLKYLRRVAEKNGGSNATSQPLRERSIPCFLQLADEKDFPHSGFLDFVENRVSSSTGTIQVRGVFGNDDLLLTGGLFVRIRIPVSDPYKAILVPEQSIGTDQGSKFVFVVGPDNVPQRRTIELGAQRGSMRVVKSGIEAKQKVVFRGLQRIRPGQAVRAELSEPPAMEDTTPIESVQTNASPASGAANDVGNSAPNIQK